MSEAVSKPTARPGTACLGCRRRKLKCTREQQGCNNCTKADLPCVYPAPETGTKRKRGPYKKDKPPREKHLEELVKYLKPETAGIQHSESSDSPKDWRTSQNDRTTNDSPATEDTSLVDHHDRSELNLDQRTEILAADVLTTLSNPDPPAREAMAANEFHSSHRPSHHPSDGFSTTSQHPPAWMLFEFWQLFVVRVDPMTKIIHWPTFSTKVFAAIDNPDNVSGTTNTLLFSIYFAAVSSCTPAEAQQRFGESRDTLRRRYGQVVELALSFDYTMPTLESLQGLVLFITCVRREDDCTNLRALFSLTVRMAQLMGLHEDSGENLSPYETQLRRRIWWHICSLESRGAEEGEARPTSIMDDRNVKLPANLNDHDLDPKADKAPQPRQGVTDMTFSRLKFEVVVLVHKLLSTRKKLKDQGPDDIKNAQRQVLKDVTSRWVGEYSRHFHASRPMDWLCMQFVEGMSIKAALVVEHPFGTKLDNSVSIEEWHKLLRASVDLVRTTHGLSADPRIENWRWYFRGYIQWHPLAIVVAELGHSTNPRFSKYAWEVLDPILVDWDKAYRIKREEPAWDHVNVMVERARRKGKEAGRPEKETPGAPIFSGTSDHSSTLPSGGADNQGAFEISLQPPTTAAFGTSSSTELPLPHPLPTTQNALTPHSLDWASSSSSSSHAHGCAPTSMDFEIDYNAFNDAVSIDFQAFGAVFSDSAWEFPSDINPIPL